MPQFDIFSFFSQLFWVLFGFTFFYLLSTFFLLPALSTILKIRKRKLSVANNNNSTNNSILTNSKTVYNVFSTYIHNLTSQLIDIKTDTVISNNLISALSKISIKFDTINMLKTNTQNTAQKLIFLFK
jgi:uncharacterized membrane protein